MTHTHIFLCNSKDSTLMQDVKIMFSHTPSVKVDATITLWGGCKVQTQRSSLKDLSKAVSGTRGTEFWELWELETQNTEPDVARGQKQYTCSSRVSCAFSPACK